MVASRVGFLRLAHTSNWCPARDADVFAHLQITYKNCYSHSVKTHCATDKTRTRTNRGYFYWLYLFKSMLRDQMASHSWLLMWIRSHLGDAQQKQLHICGDQCRLSFQTLEKPRTTTQSTRKHFQISSILALIAAEAHSQAEHKALARKCCRYLVLFQVDRTLDTSDIHTQIHTEHWKRLTECSQRLKGQMAFRMRYHLMGSEICLLLCHRFPCMCEK